MAQRLARYGRSPQDLALMREAVRQYEAQPGASPALDEFIRGFTHPLSSQGVIGAPLAAAGYGFDPRNPRRAVGNAVLLAPSTQFMRKAVLGARAGYRGYKLGRQIIGQRTPTGPEYSQDWRLNPRSKQLEQQLGGATATSEPYTRGRMIEAGPGVGPFPDYGYTRRGEAQSRLDLREIIQQHVGGNRGYIWGHGSMNIVGGRPGHIPSDWQLNPRTGQFYAPEPKPSLRTQKVTEPYEPGLRGSGIPGPAYPDRGFTKKTGDVSAQEERDLARAVIDRFRRGEQQYGPVKPGSMNLLGRAPHGQGSLPGRGDLPVRRGSAGLGLGLAAALLGSVPFSHRDMSRQPGLVRKRSPVRPQDTRIAYNHR